MRDYDDDYYTPDPVVGYCDACNERCEGIAVDEGIGQYEYWGCIGYDTQIVYYSDCCEADINLKQREEIEDAE